MPWKYWKRLRAMCAVAAIFTAPHTAEALVSVCPDIGQGSWHIDCGEFWCNVCSNTGAGWTCHTMLKVEARLIAPGYCAIPDSEPGGLVTRPPEVPEIEAIMLDLPDVRNPGISVPLPPPALAGPRTSVPSR